MWGGDPVNHIGRILKESIADILAHSSMQHFLTKSQHNHLSIAVQTSLCGIWTRHQTKTPPHPHHIDNFTRQPSMCHVSEANANLMYRKENEHCCNGIEF